MSVTDDALKAKFSTLSETQDSIVSVANWMIFHRRHADRVVQAWHNRIREISSPKRLNLIYLANEVVQQSRLRNKNEFPDAFSPIIADSVQLAYKGAVTDVQQKLRRVVEVWRARNVFEGPIVDAIEARLDDIDKAKGSGKKPLMGGSLFSSPSGSVPKELESLVPLQTAVSKASLSSNTAKTTADTEYDKLHDTNSTLPPPPVHAARLSSLMKALANAESSVNESMKARKQLIAGLEKILESNKVELSKDEAKLAELYERKAATEAKKREVEDAIMRGMSTSAPVHDTLESNGDSANAGNDHALDLDRPEYEALTPPPVEALTPPPADQTAPVFEDSIPENTDVTNLLAAMSGAPPMQPTTSSTLVRPRSSSGGMNGSSTGIKKRKMSHEEEIAGLGFAGTDALDDLDDDVAELLRQESAKV